MRQPFEELNEQELNENYAEVVEKLRKLDNILKDGGEPVIKDYIGDQYKVLAVNLSKIAVQVVDLQTPNKETYWVPKEEIKKGMEIIKESKLEENKALKELENKLNYWINKAKELDNEGKTGEADKAWDNAKGVDERITELKRELGIKEALEGPTKAWAVDSECPVGYKRLYKQQGNERIKIPKCTDTGKAKGESLSVENLKRRVETLSKILHDAKVEGDLSKADMEELEKDIEKAKVDLKTAKMESRPSNEGVNEDIRERVIQLYVDKAMKGDPYVVIKEIDREITSLKDSLKFLKIREKQGVDVKPARKDILSNLPMLDKAKKMIQATALRPSNESKINEARSIGKRWIDRIKQATKEEWKRSKTGAFGFAYNINYGQLEQAVKKRIPNEVFDSWEGAYTEIENIISDQLMNLAHGVEECQECGFQNRNCICEDAAPATNSDWISPKGNSGRLYNFKMPQLLIRPIDAKSAKDWTMKKFNDLKEAERWLKAKGWKLQESKLTEDMYDAIRDAITVYGELLRVGEYKRADQQEKWLRGFKSIQKDIDVIKNRYDKRIKKNENRAVGWSGDDARSYQFHSTDLRGELEHTRKPGDGKSWERPYVLNPQQLKFLKGEYERIRILPQNWRNQDVTKDKFAWEAMHVAKDKGIVPKGTKWFKDMPYVVYEGKMLTVEEVRKICPPCAEKMKKKGLKKVARNLVENKRTAIQVIKEWEKS